jgi:hypothetical protein
LGNREGKRVSDSAPSLFQLTIPCKIGKPENETPIYIVKENKNGGPESGFWKCRHCSREFANRKSWAKHSGLITNIPATCERFTKGNKETI